MFYPKNRKDSQAAAQIAWVLKGVAASSDGVRFIQMLKEEREDIHSQLRDAGLDSVQILQGEARMLTKIINGLEGAEDVLSKARLKAEKKK